MAEAVVVCYQRCLICGRCTRNQRRVWNRWFDRSPEECADPRCLQRLVDWSANPLADLRAAGVTDPVVLARVGGT